MASRKNPTSGRLCRGLVVGRPLVRRQSALGAALDALAELLEPRLKTVDAAGHLEHGPGADDHVVVLLFVDLVDHVHRHAFEQPRGLPQRR